MCSWAPAVVARRPGWYAPKPSSCPAFRLRGGRSRARAKVLRRPSRGSARGNAGALGAYRSRRSADAGTARGLQTAASGRLRVRH